MCLREYLAAEITIFGIDYSPMAEDLYVKKKKKDIESKEQEEFIQKLSEQVHDSLASFTRKEKAQMYQASENRDPVSVYQEFIEAKKRHAEEVQVRRQRLESMPKLWVIFGIPTNH